MGLYSLKLGKCSRNFELKDPVLEEERLPKIALKWMPKQNRARGRPKKNWMEGIKKAMNERNLNEGQWEDRQQWSLGVGQRRKTF